MIDHTTKTANFLIHKWTTGQCAVTDSLTAFFLYTLKVMQ
jgi:hypothetical protein